ncbi:MAG TPA: phosphatase PAP2 family protein [Allosphingosinicella sp.]|jgi:membrane-associated phospholipid phosphatase
MNEATKTLKDGAQALEDADAAVAEAVLPIRHAPGMRFVGALSDIADQPQLRALSGGLVALGLLGRNRRLARAGLRMLISHELATAAKNAIKRRVDRTRPRSLGDGEAPTIRAGETHSKEQSSFPSGHSAGAAATARAFAREYPEHRAAAHAAAGLAALTQIPRCAHYPTDVGVGLAIGVATEAALNLVFPRERRPQAAEQRPGLPNPA